MTVLWSGHDQEGNSVSGSVPVVVTPRPVQVPQVFGDGTNRAAALQAFINAQPDGTIIDMAGLSVRADQTLQLVSRRGLTFTGGTVWTDDPTGDGSTYEAPSALARTRSHWSLVTCAGVTFNNHTIRGPAVGASSAVGGYYGPLEAQMGFSLIGSTGVRINGGEVSRTFGDGVYCGYTSGVRAYCRDVVVDGVSIHHNGRQGVGIVGGYDLHVLRCTIAEQARATMDLEPNDTDAVIDGVEFGWNTVGAHRLNFISSVGQPGHVDNVNIHDNQCLPDSYAQIFVTAGAAVRRTNWTLTNNRSSLGYGTGGMTAVWQFVRVDRITAHGNNIACQAGRSMALVGVDSCTGLDVSGNLFPNGAVEVRDVTPTPDYVPPDPGPATGNNVAPRVVGTATTGVSTNTVANLKIPADAPVGSRVFALIGKKGFAVTPPGGWAVEWTEDYGSGYWCGIVLSRTVLAGDPGSTKVVVVPDGDYTNRCAFLVFAVAGFDAVNPYDGSDRYKLDAITDTIRLKGVRTSVERDLVLFFAWKHQGSGVLTGPSDVALIAKSSNGQTPNGANVAAYAKVYEGAGLGGDKFVALSQSGRVSSFSLAMRAPQL